MTNPTLERAARAVFAAWMAEISLDMSWDESPERFRNVARGFARAVLMAVRSEMCDTVCVGAIDDILSGSANERTAEDSQQG